VNGVEIGSCLGDLYSVNWMEDADSAGLHQTIEAQMSYVVNMTTQSHVMEYGDLTLKPLPTGDFEGNGIERSARFSNHIKIGGMTMNGKNPSHIQPHGHVNSRDISLHNAFHSYTRSLPQTQKRKDSLLKLAAEVQLRLEAEILFDTLAESFLHSFASISSVPPMVDLFGPAHLPVVCDTCCKKVDTAIHDYCGGYNDYSLQYHRIIVNSCDMGKQEMVWTERMVEQVKQICEIKQVKTLMQM